MKANTDLIAQFNLPGYVKGKSFGEAAKLIQKKFKDRNDSVSQRTMEEMLTNLQQAQEYVKMQEALKNESQQVPDQMGGAIPEGMEEFSGGQPEGGQPFAGGGFMEQSGEAFKGEDGAGMAGNIAGGAGMLLTAGQDLFGKTGVNTTGTEHVAKRNVGMEAASKGLQGAAAGAKIGGPLGAAIGGVVMGGAGLIGASRANKDANIANNNFVQAESSKLRESDFAYGGSVNKYENGGGFNPYQFRQKPELNTDFSDITSLKGASLTKPTEYGYSNKLSTADTVAPINLDTSKLNMLPSKWSPESKPESKPGALNWLGQNAGEIARFAPVVGNALDLKNLKRGVTERGSRLDNRYKPQQFDEAQLLNQINQDNTPRALTESSGGDLGALRSNLLAADINKKKALSQGMQMASNINREEGRFKHQTDSATDAANVNLDQNFLERKAQDSAAYETTKGNLKKALYEDIGAIGREYGDRKTIERMFGYKWNGKYFVDKDGNQVADDSITERMKNLVKNKK